MLFLEVAVEPGWKECGGDAVPDLHPGHAVADGNHFSRAIRHRHDALVALDRGSRDGDVTIVEGYGADAYQHVVRAADCRRRAIDKPQRVESFEGV